MKESDINLNGTFCFHKKNSNEWYTSDWGYVLTLNPHYGWILSHYCEVDGSTWGIKKIKDIADLKKVYEAIEDKEFV